MRNITNKRGEIVSDNNEILEVWCGYFMKQIKEQQCHKPQREGNLRWEEKGDDYIEEEETEIAISNLKIMKTPGQDQVAPEFIKYGGNKLMKVLQNFFQTIWSKKRIPKQA